MIAPEPKPDSQPSDPGSAVTPFRRLDAALLGAVLASRDSDEGVRAARVLESARQSLDAERATLWLCTDDGLTCAAATPDAAVVTRNLDPSWTAALEATRARFVPDGARHPIRRALGGERGSLLEAAVRSSVGLAGVICFERPAGARTFDQIDASVAAGIADRVAVLLADARRGPGSVDPRAVRLHEAQRLQALGRLTTGVAHDFNNALTAILGGVQLVADGLPVDSELQPTATRTLDAIAFATELARQLLDFGRSEPGERTEVGLDDVVLRIGQLLKTLLGDRRELSLQLGSAPATVRAAATRLAQVVLNLVANARDALPDGGHVTVHTRVEGEDVVLRVTDDGVGIPPAVVARIFEPLFTTKPVGQGCGLGLATVHHVVDELGGSIGVDSTPGHGTTFEIRLPRTV